VPDKALAWLGSARSDVRRFPVAVRRLAGFQLRRVQQGLDPNDWKPMSNVGAGVREIRLHVEGAHRVFYVATFADAVYVRVREEDAEDYCPGSRNRARAVPLAHGDEAQGR